MGFIVRGCDSKIDSNRSFIFKCLHENLWKMVHITSITRIFNTFSHYLINTQLGTLKCDYIQVLQLISLGVSFSKAQVILSSKYVWAKFARRFDWTW